MIAAVTSLEAILYVTPATITSLGAAIAAIIAAVRGRRGKEKLEEIDEKKLEPIKTAINGVPNGAQ